MTLMDIRNGIESILENSFTQTEIKKVYNQDNKQNLLKPCFVVSVIPITTKNEISYKTKTLMVKITYIGQRGTDAETLEMIDKLENVFGLTVKIQNRCFTLNELNPVVVDGILHFGFTLSVTDGVDVIEIMNEDGKKMVMLPDEKSGYTQDTIKFMNELNFKQEV